MVRIFFCCTPVTRLGNIKKWMGLLVPEGGGVYFIFEEFTNAWGVKKTLQNGKSLGEGEGACKISSVVEVWIFSRTAQ